MVSVEKNMYILKQSNGTTWNFTYDRKMGIVYKTFKGEMWSNYNILINAAKEKYSVSLLPNDSICIVYEDLDGSLMMCIYNHAEWKTYPLIKNEQGDIFDIYFKTVIHKNRIFLFYSIYNKNTYTMTIVSQNIDEIGNLSSPRLIDEVYFRYDAPFYVHVSSENVLYIMYQKYEYYHHLGYRMLDIDTKNWSEFYVIDKCFLPYKEYSLLAASDNLHSLYIKKDDKDIFSLIYCCGNFSSYKYKDIWSSSNINSCSFFIISGHILCLWIQDDQIYSTVFSGTENVFNNIPQSELIETPSIFKAVYQSNYLENKRYIYIDELFVANNNKSQCSLIDNIYGIIYRNNNNNYLFYVKYLLDSFYERDKGYKKKIEEKDIIIGKLKHLAEEQQIKLQSYENKFKAINNSMTNFKESRSQLNEGINFLQDSLIAKEKRLNELETLYVEKEKELELLKAEIKNMEKRKGSFTNLKKAFNKFVSMLKGMFSFE